jgi:hypothetical protein
MATARAAEKVSVAVSAALALGLIALVLPIRSAEAPPRSAPETRAEKPAEATEPAPPAEEIPQLAMIVLPPPPELRVAEQPPAVPAAAPPSRPEPPSPPPEVPAETPAETPREVPAPPQLVIKPMKSPPRPAPPPKTQAPPASPTLLKPLAPPAEPPPPEIVRRTPETPKPASPPATAREAPPETPPQQAEAARPTADTAAVSLDKEDVAQGRVLLRMLEHGAGPSIEIAWPDSARQRDKLFERLRSCFGMRLAAMDGGDRLYVAEGARGVPWELNLDRYSGFIRQPAGLLAKAEKRAFADIQSHHARLGGAQLVRLFPRQVDARGLRRQRHDPRPLPPGRQRRDHRRDRGRPPVPARPD